MQERMMQNGDAVSVQKLFEEPVILSGLLSGTGRIFGDPEPDHAWLHDESFMRIVYAAMPAVYERYRDPDNRAKGEPTLDASWAPRALELAAYEAIELLAEYKKHREGKGDPGAILHELADMTLTGMFAAACWDDMVRKTGGLCGPVELVLGGRSAAFRLRQKRGQRAGGNMLYVTVCDNCKQSSCWHGLFMCSESQSAGTIDIPLESLLIMGLEHESYLLPYAFEKTPNTDFNLTQPAASQVKS